MNIHGLLLGEGGREGHGRVCRIYIRRKTILDVKYQLRKESSGKTHLPIINSDRQAGGTGGHT